MRLFAFIRGQSFGDFAYVAAMLGLAALKSKAVLFTAGQTRRKQEKRNWLTDGNRWTKIRIRTVAVILLILPREAFMAATDILQQIGESLGSSASVKAVFGEPVQAAGRTVIPVAKVAYGFGGGFGTGHGKADRENGRHGEGGGGGGGVRAYPAGALEITESGTRFIPFPDLRLLAAAFGAGAVLGRLFWGRRRRD